jgi:hypothetical protein
MVCARCGRKIDDGSSFCKFCGTAQGPRVQPKTPVMEVCHIRRRSAPNRFGGIRVWFEAWCGSACIADSGSFESYDDSRVLLKGTSPEELDRMEREVRQAFIDKLTADGWEPSYGDNGDVNSVRREKR